MQKVLLLGDSIRMNYQSRVVEMLGETATVVAPEENCRFSAYTLFQLRSWAPDDDYDVVHWNNGQWDLAYMPDGEIFSTLPTYLELQTRIAGILRAKARRLIFALTSPVWPEFANSEVNPRRNEDIIAYNAAIRNHFASLGIAINDLYTPLAADVRRYLRDDMVHLNDAGCELCAGHVVTAIQENS